MRPIKFRGRRLDNGKIVYGDFCRQRKESVIWYGDGCFGTVVEPDSVAQLIAVDKNGKEVYEGDWVVSRFGQQCLASFRHYGEICNGGIRLVEARI